MHRLQGYQAEAGNTSKRKSWLTKRAPDVAARRQFLDRLRAATQVTQKLDDFVAVRRKGKMKLIQFKVTEELIRQALAIPDEAEIVNIVRHEFVPGLFTFYVTHPSFPECLEGALPIEADPVITADYENRPGTWLTIDFRIPISATGQ